jgi:hypothetical protein
MGGCNGLFHYFRNYVVDQSYPVPDAYMQQIHGIIEFLETRNELRYVAAKRLDVSESTLKLMIRFWNNHKTYTVKVSYER